jgi:hypothetical protein
VDKFLGLTTEQVIELRAFWLRHHEELPLEKQKESKATCENEVFESLVWLRDYLQKTWEKEHATDENGLGKIRLKNGTGLVIDKHLIDIKIFKDIGGKKHGKN